jgi:hypothetical protein
MKQRHAAGCEADSQMGDAEMLNMHANVVASYLRDGGLITKLTPCVAVTEHELLGYLQTCGFKAEQVDENFNGYLCNGKRVNLPLLLHLANGHRRSQKLPPLTMRHLL